MFYNFPEIKCYFQLSLEFYFICIWYMDFDKLNEFNKEHNCLPYPIYSRKKNINNNYRDFGDVDYNRTDSTNNVCYWNDYCNKKAYLTYLSYLSPTPNIKNLRK